MSQNLLIHYFFTDVKAQEKLPTVWGAIKE
jgi:hypothetical protein